MTEPRRCEWLWWCRETDLATWEIGNQAGTDIDRIQVCGGHTYLAARAGYRRVKPAR